MQINDGIFVEPFPETDTDESHNTNGGHGDDEVRAEPIVALTFIENDLQCAEAQREEAEADVIDFEAFAFFLLHVRRIGDEHVGEQQGNYADGNIDEENPAPIEIVGDPSAESGTDRRREHDGHAVNGECHAAAGGFESIGEDGLLAGLQASAADSLQNAKKNQHGEIGSEAAEKRANGEERDAGHVKTLAANQLGKPTAHGKNDGVGNEVGSEHPCAFILAGGKAAGNMWQGHVGDAGIENFHERGEGDGERDDPGIDNWTRPKGGIRRDGSGRGHVILR